MRPRNIAKLLSIGTIAFVMAGCGGGGNSSGGTPTPEPTPPPVASSPFEYVQEVNDSDAITIGTFLGTGVNYYDLNMPSKGNLVISPTGHPLYLYDMNLNIIGEYHNDGSVVVLEAGDYVIQYNHNYKDREFTFTLNSSVLYNQYGLALIATGTFSGSGTQYYRINMPSKGNLVISPTGHPLYLYDMNLNIIGEYHNDGSVVALEAGDYVIQYNHNYKDREFTFTLNSSVW